MLVQDHQNSFRRIEALRAEAASLDAQIRETLVTLANTRKDMVNTRTTTFPSQPNFSIGYQELLRYARRISKTSMAPAASLPESTSPESQTPQPIESQPQSATTPSAPASSRQSPNLPNGMSRPGSQQPVPNSQLAAASQNTTLPENFTQYLNPLSGQMFFPWPMEDKIRSGALASNQVLVERGIEPMGYDPVAEDERKRKEEEERKEREEKEKLERAEYERKIVEERERARVEREKQREKEQAAWRESSGAAPAPPRSGSGAAPERKQFQFANLDDLDDDDDDD